MSSPSKCHAAARGLTQLPLVLRLQVPMSKVEPLEFINERYKAMEERLAVRTCSPALNKCTSCPCLPGPTCLRLPVWAGLSQAVGNISLLACLTSCRLFASGSTPP